MTEDVRVSIRTCRSEISGSRVEGQKPAIVRDRGEEAIVIALIPAGIHRDAGRLSSTSITEEYVEVRVRAFGRKSRG